MNTSDELELFAIDGVLGNSKLIVELTLSGTTDTYYSERWEWVEGGPSKKEVSKGFKNIRDEKVDHLELSAS